VTVTPAPGDSSTAKGHAGPDALELELFRYGVESIVDELEVNITRTAHSPLVYLYKDFAVGMVTRDFQMLSQSRFNLPIFLADLGGPVQDAVEVIGRDRLEPGDVFLTNYAPPTGSHLNNVIAATPVYCREGLAGYVAIRTHWPDVGGMTPGSCYSWDATSILQEGVQYRGLRIMRRGRLVPEVLATIQANTWMPKLVTGDVMANIAACVLGVSRWEDQIAARWGLDEVDSLVEAQFRLSSGLARAKVGEVPDGEYTASAELDDSGRVGTPPLKLTVKVTIAGETMTVDLSGLPPQVNAPINSGRMGGAVSSCRVAFKSLFAPDRPADEGLFEPLEVIIPPGTVMSAVANAPMAHWNQLPPTLIDLIYRALGESLPELVPAGHYGGLGGTTVTGYDPDNEWWMATFPAQGGHGGHSEGDGYGPLMTLMHGDNPRIPDEVAESLYPVRILSRKLRREAGGRGWRNGGPGIEHTYELLEDAQVAVMINRTRNPAWGLAGGEDGLPGEVHVADPGKVEWRSLGRMSPAPFPAGTRVRLRTGGGGGWGSRGQ
jgi:N-methylhydantoinase B